MKRCRTVDRSMLVSEKPSMSSFCEVVAGSRSLSSKRTNDDLPL